MSIKTYKWDAAKFLDTTESQRAYLEEAFETGNHALIAEAIGEVARARGMHNIAEDTGLSREQLYRTLSKKGNPTLKSLFAILAALGLKITVTSA